MPKKTRMMMEFEAYERAGGREPQQTLKETRTLLRYYRHIAWRAKLEHATGAENTELPQGAALLSQLMTPGQCRAPQRGYAEAAALMRRVLAQIAEYPEKGSLYHDILENAYFTDHPVADEVFWASLHIDRSSFYQRKQEAILLFALCCAPEIGNSDTVAR